MECRFAAPVFLLATTLFLACPGCTGDERHPYAVPDAPAKPLSVDSLVILTEDLTTLSSDPYWLVDADLAGVLLRLIAEVSGGCEEHHYQLHVARYFAESNPVQTWAYLVHDDADDPCESVYQETLNFDVTPVIELYMEYYGRIDPILIHIYSSEEMQPGEWLTVLYSPTTGIPDDW